MRVSRTAIDYSCYRATCHHRARFVAASSVAHRNLMRLLSTAPRLHFAATPLARTCTPRCDVLDDLKYQLSNADPESRPARDLVENPVAAAYLVVLAIFGGGLAYLLYLDTQAKAKRESALREQEMAIAMMREQGNEEAAAVLAKDLKRERKPPKPAEKPKGLAADPYGDEGNRFERRQGREAKSKEAKKARRQKRKRGRN